MAIEFTDMDEPKDGDETQRIADIFRIELDWSNGNLTPKEYEQQLNAVQ